MLSCVCSTPHVLTPVRVFVDDRSTSSDEKGSNVRLLQLEALVKKGEKKGIFAGKLPGRIQKMVSLHF